MTVMSRRSEIQPKLLLSDRAMLMSQNLKLTSGLQISQDAVDNDDAVRVSISARVVDRRIHPRLLRVDTAINLVQVGGVRAGLSLLKQLRLGWDRLIGLSGRLELPRSCCSSYTHRFWCFAGRNQRSGGCTPEMNR